MIHTAYDVMKEFLITDADLEGKYGIPKIPKTFIHPGKDTVDFAESFSRKIKNHRELDVNFYVDDVQFQRLWNQPDKYIEHLKCFHAVIMPDFSISVGKNGMPLVMCLWNKYRNHALAHYMILNDIPVIPNVSILPEYCWDWCFDGLPVLDVSFSRFCGASAVRFLLSVPALPYIRRFEDKSCSFQRFHILRITGKDFRNLLYF